MSRVCPNCGSQISQSNLKGQSFPWRDFTSVELLFDFEGQQCRGCGEIFLRGSAVDGLEGLLEKSVREQTLIFVQKLKQHTNLNQKALAEIISITPEYFSNISKGKKVPSAVIFGLLKLAALSDLNILQLKKFKGVTENLNVIDLQKLESKFKYLNQQDFLRIPSRTVFDNVLCRQQSEVLH